MTDPGEVEVFLNGQARRVPSGASLVEVLRAAGAPVEGVAVEVNLAIVRRADLASRRVAPGDRIEVVGFVGGG